MPFMKPKTNLTLLRTGTWSLGGGNADTFTGRLEALRWRGFTSSSEKETAGLVPMLDDESSGFENVNHWLSPDRSFAALGLRVETKKIPGGLAKRETARRCAEWAREHEVERVPTSVRREIRGMVEEALLAKALPATRIHQIVLFPEEGVCWTDTLSDSGVDRVRKTLRRLGVTAVPHRPLDMVEDPALLGVPKVARDESGSVEDETPTPPNVTSGFLCWLWLSSLGSDLEVGLSSGERADVHVLDRMGFRREGESKVTTLLTSDDCAHSAEAVAALGAGEVLDQIRMAAVVDDFTTEITFSGVNLQRKGIKLDLSASDGDSDAMGLLMEWVLTMERSCQIWRDVFRAYTDALLRFGGDPAHLVQHLREANGLD